MNLEIRAIIFSLVTLLGWGLETAVSKKYARFISSSKILVYRDFLTALIVFIFLTFFIKSAKFDLGYVLFGIFISFLGYMGYYFLLKALKTGNLGIVSPISSSRMLVAAIMGTFFLNDFLSFKQIVFVFIIFIGVILSSVNFSNISKSEIFSLKSGVPFAILNAMLWGVAFPLYSIPSAILGAFLFSFILEGTGFVSSIVHTKLLKINILLTKEEVKKGLPGLLMMGLLGGIASVCVNLGYATGKVVIVSSISSAVPLITILCSRFVYKEKLRNIQYVAVVLMIVGIVSLAYFKS